MKIYVNVCAGARMKEGCLRSGFYLQIGRRFFSDRGGKIRWYDEYAEAENMAKLLKRDPNRLARLVG